MKLLFVLPDIYRYRLEIFNKIGKKYDMTILHSGNYMQNSNLEFSQIVVPQKKIGPFNILKKPIHNICKKYDVVISNSNIRLIDRNMLICNPFRKYKWITWGIGVSASYDKKYDQCKKYEKIRHFILKRADANIFYTEYPVKRYIDAGFNKNSLFVAHNTTYVKYNDEISYKKKKIIFVGSLYKQKGIYELIETYKKYYYKNTNPKPLHIIGDGPEYGAIKKWIQNNKLTEHIIMHGSIYKHDILEKHFREAIACISPGQAGLTVLTSMGYGTPFITRYDAITGGEIFNIKNGNNGILYNNKRQLENYMHEMTINKEKYIRMGEEARKYYLKHRTPDIMVQAFIDAIMYVTQLTEYKITDK